jgi:hypothetical protein
MSVSRLVKDRPTHALTMASAGRSRNPVSKMASVSIMDESVMNPSRIVVVR